MTEVFLNIVYEHLNASPNPSYISVSLEAAGDDFLHGLPSTRYVQVHRHVDSIRIIYNILAWPVKPVITAGTQSEQESTRVVPVIYFTLYDHNPHTGNLEAITNVDKVIDLIVPQIYHGQVRGGISQGINPATGLPGFFLHPCRTEAWMKSMGFGTPSNDGAKYVVWLQTFGQVVGL
jgi:hypothetical protein